MATDLGCINDEDILVLSGDVICWDNIDRNKRITFRSQAQKWYGDGVTELVYVCGVVVIMMDVIVAFAWHGNTPIDLSHGIGL